MTYVIACEKEPRGKVFWSQVYGINSTPIHASVFATKAGAESKARELRNAMPERSFFVYNKLRIG